LRFMVRPPGRARFFWPCSPNRGVERAAGDPEVVLAMDAVLSTWFAWMVVWGLDLLGAATLTAVNVATLAIVLFGVTYVVALR